MKYFLDTEFIEHHSGIDLVSIGIVDEQGSMFYAESSLFDERKADNWVRENVLSQMTLLENRRNSRYILDDSTRKGKKPEQVTVFGTDQYIAKQVIEWIGYDTSPEFYAYFADYDWVLFCRLFGRMIDLPKNFPMWCIDLKQMMWERGLNREWKQKVCPDLDDAHNALVDAKWNFELYNKIKEHESKV